MPSQPSGLTLRRGCALTRPTTTAWSIKTFGVLIAVVVGTGCMRRTAASVTLAQRSHRAIPPTGGLDTLPGFVVQSPEGIARRTRTQTQDRTGARRRREPIGHATGTAEEERLMKINNQARRYGP